MNSCCSLLSFDFDIFDIFRILQNQRLPSSSEREGEGEMLNAKAILAEAERTVGVIDTDSGVADNLERLIASIAANFPISEAGVQRIHRGLLRDSIARLEGLKWLRDYPEIAQEPITAPVFLMGLPRFATH